MDLTIRDIDPADAEAIVGILNPIIEARTYTVLVEPFSVDAERDFIVNFPSRGIWKVAVRPSDRRLLGFQLLEPFGAYTKAFDHVGILGTYVDLEQRRQGVASALFAETLPAARQAGYEKIFTFVRADNGAALATYRVQGFEVIGTARRHAKIDGRYIDEVLIEKVLPYGTTIGDTLAGAYCDDLAYIHDSGFGAVARDAAARLVAELASLNRPSGTIVDLGCGSGILAAALINAGYHVVGIELSEAMVALARTRAPQADVRVDSFVSAELPTCVAVSAIGEVLNYAFDPANTERARADLFRRVYHALLPGGVFLFDVAGPERARVGMAQRTHATGADWAVLAETRVDTEAAVLTRTITTFREVGTLYRRDDEVHRLVLIDPAAVRESLASVGFEVSVIPRYNATALPAGVVAFLARKF